jgi:hypothetical protein
MDKVEVSNLGIDKELNKLFKEFLKEFPWVHGMW